MGIEADLVNRRKSVMEKTGPEIDECIGGKKTGSNRRLPRQAVVLGDGVKCQKRQHSPSCCSSSCTPVGHEILSSEL